MTCVVSNMYSNVQRILYCLTLTIYQLSHRFLCAPPETMVRHGICIDDVLETLSQHQFNASSVLDPQSEQFQPYQSRLKSILEDNVTLLSQAWCPADMHRDDFKEWLEMTLPQLYLITNIMTKGRRQGNTQAFVSAYRVRYQREDDGPWFTYTSMEGSEIIPGNTDGFNHVRRTLDSPIVARRVRIYPEASKNNARSAKICLKMKLFGCPFDDGVIEYRAPMGFVGSLPLSGELFRVIDHSYDNQSLSECIASLPAIGKNPSCPLWWIGGMGILMDNKIYSNSDLSKNILDRSSANYFVGWRRSETLQRISLALRFHQVHEVHEIHFYTINMPSRQVAPFKSIHIHSTISDICSNSTRLRELDIPRLDMSQTPDKFSRLMWITIKLSVDTQQSKPFIGRFLCVDLIQQGDFLLLGEIRVNATPIFLTSAEELQLKEKESGTSLQPDSNQVSSIIPSVIASDVNSHSSPVYPNSERNNNMNGLSFPYQSSSYSLYMLIALIILSVLLCLVLIGSFICALARYKRFRRFCVTCLQYPRRWSSRSYWDGSRSKKKQIHRTSLSPTNSACYSGRSGSEALFPTGGMRHSNTVGSGGFNYAGPPQWIDYKLGSNNSNYPYNVASLSRLSNGTADESHSRSLTPLANEFYPQQLPGYNLPPPPITSVVPGPYPISSFHLPDAARRYFHPSSQQMINAAAAVPLLSSPSVVSSQYPLQPFYVTYASKGSSQMPLIESFYSNPSQTYDHTLSSRINRLSMASTVSVSANDPQGTASTNTSLIVNSEAATAPNATNRAKTPSPPTNSTSASLEEYSSPEKEEGKKEKAENSNRSSKHPKGHPSCNGRGSSIDNPLPIMRDFPLKPGDRTSFVLQERQPVGPPLPPNHPSSIHLPPGTSHFPHPESMQFHRFHPFIFHGVQTTQDQFSQ